MQDALGIVPPAIRARYERTEAVEREVREARELNRQLRDRFGADTEVVRVGPRADPGNFSGNVIPGYWHIRIHAPPPAVPHYMPITTPEGGYREPGPRVLGELLDADLRRPEVMERVLAQTRTDSPQKAAERALRTEQRRDVMAMDYKAARRTRGEGGLRKPFEAKRRAGKKPA